MTATGGVRSGSPARTIITIGLLVGALVLGLVVVDRATRGREQTTYDSRGSTRSTAPDGVRAYRDLLDRYDVQTIDLAGSIPAYLAPGVTLFVLNGGYPSDRDRARVRAFVRRGGRVVVGGEESDLWLGVDGAHIGGSGPVDTTATVDGRTFSVTADASPRWSDPTGAVVITRRQGTGTTAALSTTSTLQNRRLGQRDNAAFGLALVGRGRRAAFAEGLHGLSAASGFAAIPSGWRIALFGVPLALLLGAVAAGRRIGGAEPHGRDLVPPRRVAVDAVAGALERSKRPEPALAPLRREVRRDLCRRAGLPDDASDDDIRDAAIALGWSPAETVAITSPVATTDAVLALGRAYSRTRRGSP